MKNSVNQEEYENYLQEESMSGEYDYVKDLIEIDAATERERLYSEKYKNDFISSIKNIRKEDLISIANNSVPHKVPIKLRIRNFINKLFNIL